MCMSENKNISDLNENDCLLYAGDPKDGLGYINLSGFNSGAGRDFRQAMVMLRYSSPVDLKGLILDLRGNPGGLLGD